MLMPPSTVSRLLPKYPFIVLFGMLVTEWNTAEAAEAAPKLAWPSSPIMSQKHIYVLLESNSDEFF